MLEDLIGRYKLRDYQAALLAFIFGSITSTFFIPAKYFYKEPLILGIHWGNLLWFYLVWWIFLQTIMALYISNRLFPRKEWSPLIKRGQWIICIVIYVFFGSLFRSKIPRQLFPNLIGFVSSITLIIIAILFFIMIIKRNIHTIKARSKSWFMDIISLLTVLLFLILALVSPGEVALYDYHPISHTALLIVVFWTTVTALVFYLYRILSKKQIPI